MRKEGAERIQEILEDVIQLTKERAELGKKIEGGVPLTPFEVEQVMGAVDAIQERLRVALAEAERLRDLFEPPMN